MGMREYMDIINEAMSRSEALAIFQRHGVRADGMDAASLKLAHRGLAKRLHADLGGQGDDMALVNAAYDELSKPARYGGGHGFSEYRPGGAGRQERPGDDGEDRAPAWAQAGHAGGLPNSGRISRQDYSDINFVRKRMWELCGRQTRQAWTIMNFDGTFFRQSITVYATPAIFPEMARAIREHDRFFECRAVFVQEDARGDDKTVLLIWSDGIEHNPPIPMEHDSVNRNVGNDRHFTRRLPAVLDRIKAQATDDD